MSTLAGQDDQAAEIVADEVPTSLGGGVIPVGASVAREVAFDPNCTWRRMLTDPRGCLLDYGRTTYRPPAPLAKFVRARDRRCTFPFCTRPAVRCDLDHRKDWNHGGTTCECNVHPLCERHHYLKHNTEWIVERLADGTTRWTTPSGRTYDSPQASYPVDRTDPDLFFRDLSAPEDHDPNAPEDPPPPF